MNEWTSFFLMTHTSLSNGERGLRHVNPPLSEKEYWWYVEQHLILYFKESH